MGKNKTEAVKDDAPKKDSRDNHEDDLDDIAKNSGPVERRSCQDILCCLLFIAFIGGMGYCAIAGFTDGDPIRLTAPYDSAGNACGFDSGYEDFPYLYFVSTNVLYSRYLYQWTICVEECPSISWEESGRTFKCEPNELIDSCSGTHTLPRIDVDGKNNGDVDIEVTLYATVIWFDRLCIPDPDSPVAGAAYDSIVDQVTSGGFADTMREWMSDLYLTWPIMFAVAGIALVFGLVYMVFVKYCAGPVTTIIIILMVALIALIGYFFAFKADQYNEPGEEDTQKWLRYLSYTFYGIAVICLLIVICYCNQIRLAVGILKTAADYIKDETMILFVPPVIFLFIIAFMVYWVVVALYLYSSGELKKRGNTPLVTVEFDQTLERMLWYHLFGLFWVTAFILAVEQFIIASSTCIWYFEQAESGAHKTISRSVYRCFRYHLGSLAFGSLILAIVQFVRFLLEYIAAKADEWGGRDNQLIKAVLCCLRCCVACFEKCIKFLNKNAYIQIALTGKNFCTCAKNAFFMFMHNAARFSIMLGIGAIFIMFGKLCIAFGATFVGYLIITESDKYKDKLYSPIFPTVIFFVIAWVIATLFMSVYGMSCDSILQCFIADEEIAEKNGGSPHTPPALSKFISKHAPKDKDKKTSKSCC